MNKNKLPADEQTSSSSWGKSWDASDEFGYVRNEPFRIAWIHEDDEIDSMDPESLKNALREIQEIYLATLSKLDRMEVTEKVKKRNPFALELIEQGVRDGLTDEQLADILGESVKWVANLRRESQEVGYFDSMLKPRGRPKRKNPDASRSKSK